VAIVGVSFDSPAVNEAWAEDEGFNFDLWTDDDKTLALTYGAASSADQRYADRKTFILDADGYLVLEYETVGPTSSPEQVLQDCTALFGP